MALKRLFVAVSMAVALTPISAAKPEGAQKGVAPVGSGDTRYCMRVGPLTGSRVEIIRCWTREQWAEQGVDVDEEWAEEGIAIKE